VVGSRRGKFEILTIEAMKMRADGYKIYKSENGVYLVDEVPPKYIKILKKMKEYKINYIEGVELFSKVNVKADSFSSAEAWFKKYIGNNEILKITLIQ